MALDGPPSRVVSLLPSLTELVLALGEGERLVARTRYDRDPRVRDLPSVGGGLRPNLETIGRLLPDLVLTWADEGDDRLVDRLEALHIPVYSADSQTLIDIRRHTKNLGRMLDVEKRADRLLDSIDQGLAQIRSRVDGVERPTVFYVVWLDPPTTAGPKTYLDSLISIAGGTNAFFDAPARWPQVSLEEVLRRDPDVVVLATRHDGSPAESTWIHERSGWRSLTAVRRDRVLVVDADLFNRPGPRVVEAARTLAKFLHPERFQDEADG
ncbi:MAG: ABC transporter substrate-binding protein [Gemmatimonadetes bacterium]|nr:cobalamin-binding protein [Gemmatimonadota bacterium]NIR77300.1 cobalamin-binding protein [Gemmatimonadota bacterium]NIT85821.1 cobalamin-binding protein [Gemmatimonadota bacterium]NIU29644.1 cobalamin-binding protein [Gemmatimonadota bacterium]NIU34691.1 ABC transporter substrate-binding protein [Gemmatimonadota bacterium]